MKHKRKAYVILDEDGVAWSLCMSKWAVTMRIRMLVKLTDGQSKFHAIDIPLDPDMFLTRRCSKNHWLISTGKTGQCEPITVIKQSWEGSWPTKYATSQLE